MRLEAGEWHGDDSRHQLLPKGRCIGKAQQISDGVPNLPFLLEHKFTATAGVASFNNLQWYNQIIIFVMVRVLLLSRIIPTEALDGNLEAHACWPLKINSLQQPHSQSFVFLPLVQTTWGQDIHDKYSHNAAMVSQETTVLWDHYLMLGNCLCSVLQHIILAALVLPASLKFIGGCRELVRLRKGEGITRKPSVDPPQRKLANTTVDWTHIQPTPPSPKFLVFSCARYFGRYLSSKLHHQLNWTWWPSAGPSRII